MVIIGKRRLTETPHEMFIPGQCYYSTVFAHILKMSDVKYKHFSGSASLRDDKSEEDRKQWALRFSEAAGRSIPYNCMPKFIVNLDPDYVFDLVTNAMNDPDIKTYIESLSS